MHKVTIFTSPTCMYCKAAKKYMEEKGVSYEEKDISKDMEARDELIAKGYRGVPIIRIDGEDMVGFDKESLDQIFNA